jgi:hypothetical protein
MPRVGVGVDWNVRDEDAPPKSPLIEYGGWLAMSNVGITSLRVDATITHPGWSLSAREQVYPRIYLYTNAHSGEATFAPSRVAVGVLWSMPTTSDWTLRLERATTLPDADTTWTLSLRGELHTAIPARPGVPLGEGGLCFPELPDHSPNEVVPLTAPADNDAWKGCARRPGG